MRFNFKVKPKKENVRTALRAYAKQINLDFEELRASKKRSLSLPKSRLLGKRSGANVGFDAQLFTANVKEGSDFYVLVLDVIVKNPLIDRTVTSSASWVAHQAWWRGFREKIKKDLRKRHGVKVKIKELKEWEGGG